MRKRNRRRGDGKERQMNTRTQGAAASSASIPAIGLAALVGAVLIFTAGFAQPDALHDAAHDVRHAAGFPCH